VRCQTLTFSVQSLTAPWSPRYASNIEFFPSPMQVVLPDNSSRAFSSGVFLLQGDGMESTNDGQQQQQSRQQPSTDRR
jgi:hypothetical protein